MKKKYLAMVAKIGLEKGADLPEWFVIFAAGTTEIEGDGSFVVDELAYEAVLERIERRGIEIVFDYEHQTLCGDKAPAAGWCKQWRYRDGVGIEARVEWTEKAAEFLAAGEYRYFSPVFYVRQSDRRLAAVTSVALTNSPKTNKLQPLIAKMGIEEEDDMNLLQLLIAAFGMSEDSNEAAVVAKAKELLEKGNMPLVAKDILTALEMEDGDVRGVVASIHAIKQVPKTMVPRADFDALRAKVEGQEAETLVAAALKEGKITPDQKDWATTYAKADAAGFTTFVAKAPQVVPVGGLPPGSPPQEDGALSPEEKLVAKQMGVDEADLIAAKKVA